MSAPAQIYSVVETFPAICGQTKILLPGGGRCTLSAGENEEYGQATVRV
jgi:hypothetical protein